jgi:hypothetical protein
MDNDTKTVVLRAEPMTFHLDYELPTPVQTIMFRGITPKSPLQLGLSADARRLGFAIDKLDCVSATRSN